MSTTCKIDIGESRWPVSEVAIGVIEHVVTSSRVFSEHDGIVTWRLQISDTVIEVDLNKDGSVRAVLVDEERQVGAT